VRSRNRELWSIGRGSCRKVPRAFHPRSPLETNKSQMSPGFVQSRGPTKRPSIKQTMEGRLVRRSPPATSFVGGGPGTDELFDRRVPSPVGRRSWLPANGASPSTIPSFGVMRQSATNSVARSNVRHWSDPVIDYQPRRCSSSQHRISPFPCGPLRGRGPGGLCASRPPTPWLATTSDIGLIRSLTTSREGAAVPSTGSPPSPAGKGAGGLGGQEGRPEGLSSANTELASGIKSTVT
jgi:hypothetical protein